MTENSDREGHASSTGRCPIDHANLRETASAEGHAPGKGEIPGSELPTYAGSAAHSLRNRPAGTTDPLAPLAEGECPYASTEGPVKGDGGEWRPRSRRQGVGPVKYVISYTAHFAAEWANHKLAPWLAPNPHIGESWPWWFMRKEDFAAFIENPGEVSKLRTFPGLLFLIAKLDYIRSNPLTDAYAYKTNDTKANRDWPANARNQVSITGEGVSDDGDPQMGAALTRIGANRPPLKVRPDPEKIRPAARTIGRRLLWRKVDPETGQPVEIYAQTMNVLGATHINKQSHGFNGLSMRLKLCCNPHRIPREPHEGWPNDEALIDRTPVDPTRIGYDGRPTVINERVMAWIMGETYGTNERELARLRSFQGGKLKLGEDGLLPEDPDRPGADLTGFNNNYHVFLSLLHWLAVKEHNAIAEYLARFHPDWDDERLFQEARKTNIGENALFHTPYWTGDLLQHPVLGTAMDADWWGLIGPDAKQFLMRLAHRHKWVEKLITPIRHNFVLWGMFGGKWEHHDGPYQPPVHFRLAYRVLHPMWLDHYDFKEAGSDRFLTRLGLLEIINEHTRPVVKLLGYENIAWTAVTTPCGAPTLHNFPLALTRFHNFQDGGLTDLAERDVFRERTDGTGTWNDVRVTLGQHRLENFMQAAGGNAALAAELEEVFEGNIEKLEPVTGMLVEFKPPGSALGATQFIEFEKDAPRRGTNNYHFTDGWNHANYHEGMDWIEHSGGPLGMLARHLPGLKPLMEGVVRPYAPWKDVERFPERMLTRVHADTFAIFKSDLRTFWLAALALGISTWLGIVAPGTAGLILLPLGLSGAGLEVKRMFAMRYLQLCWRICNTDKKGFYFGTLYKAERWINRAAFLGRLQAKAVLLGFGALAWGVHSAHPLVAILFALTALSGFATRKLSNKFAGEAQILKIALRKRMRADQPRSQASDLAGDTALLKRYWLLKGRNVRPVATFDSCMEVLTASGLPYWTALGTTVLSLIGFGKKTQKGMTWRQKWENGIGLLFDRSIYLPNLHQAFGDSATRVYARSGNTRGLKAGEIDTSEFAYQCDKYSPGRDYFTRKDLLRMAEGNWVRDAREGRGNFISRFIGYMAFRRRVDQLMLLFANEVKAEIHSLVPAITHEEYLRVLDGTAWADLIAEHRRGDNDPSPIGRPGQMNQLKVMSAKELADLYANSSPGVVPNGDAQGQAFVMKGTLTGWILSRVANFVWKGKVIDNEQGELPCYLINKILGRRLVRAKINYGPSWFDGKQSIIIDYKETSWLAFFIRDEVRQIQPGFFGGYAYIRLPFGRRWNALFFALDFRK